MPELENEPALDPKMVYLWSLYLDIKSGCENIRYTDIDAYSRTTGIMFTPWEVSIMVHIDRLRASNG